MKVGEGYFIFRVKECLDMQVVKEIPGSPSLQLHIPKGAFTKTHLAEAQSGHNEGRRPAVERSASTFLFAHFWTYVCHEMKRIMVTPREEASINDLVPANLAKARGDAVPVISAKYTKVGESIRRNAPQEVRYDT